MSETPRTVRIRLCSIAAAGLSALAIGAGTATAAGWDGAEADAYQKVEQRSDAPSGELSSSLRNLSDSITQQSLETQVASKVSGTVAGTYDDLLRP